MNGTASGGLGFFGAWQVINLVLATGIDAPWNKVQHKALVD